MTLTALRWRTETPFGTPVEPEVKMTYAVSSAPGPAGSGRSRAVSTSFHVLTTGVPGAPAPRGAGRRTTS
jgi:hypothetical protein